MINHSLKDIKHNLNSKDLIDIAKKLEGYSGSDIVNIIKDAAYQPIKEASKSGKWMTMSKNELPCVSKKHFLDVIKDSHPSCPMSEVKMLKSWK